MRGLSIQLLGALQVTLDGQPVTNFGYDKVRALLAFLAAEQDHPHRRETLAGLLWPDQPEPAAESSLRNALSRLRRALSDHQADPPYLIATREAIQFNPNCPHWLDLSRFSELLDACHTHPHRRIEACPSCTDRLLEAVNLLHGEYLEGFCLPDNDLFEDWLRLQRDLLHHRTLGALEQLAATYLWRGEPEKALTYTHRQLSLEPCREEAYTQGMKIHAALGERTEACELYEHCKQQLEHELGLAPSDETTHLYEQIKYGLFQPASAQAVRFNNLPTHLTSFVGREQELREIRLLLEDPICRMLSLVGPGGVGKTRLAIAAAAQQLSCFPNGACFVPLVGVSSTDGIVPAILQALGDRSAVGDLKKHLLDYLREKELVLILDNFEHLLAGANLTNELLQQAPGLLLIVTSRQRLGLQAEWVFEVGGLSYPRAKENHELSSYEAVKLFTQRLHQLKPRHSMVQDDLVSVSHICQLVEGLPLAIELAAAAARQKPIAQVASSIEVGKEDLSSAWTDVPERHRSIRAVFDHSFKMLNIDAQVAFTALGVFRSGFIAEAAEQVAGATPQVLETLVEHSLVRYDETQGLYTLHELVRQYASDKLLESPEKDRESHRRHGEYFFDEVEKWDSIMYFSRQSIALKEMDQHQPDLQATWDWACQQQDLSLIALGMRPLLHYYVYRRRVQESYKACMQALDAVESLELNNIFAKRLEFYLLIMRLELLSILQTQLRDEETKKHWERCFLLLGELEDAGEDIRWEKVKIVMEMSAWTLDVDAQFRYAKESVDLARQLGDETSLGLCLNNLTLMYQAAGKSSEAENCCREALIYWRKLDKSFHIMRELSIFSEIAAHLGNLEEAERAAKENARIEFSMDNPNNTIDGLQTLADTCYYCRKWDEANKYYSKTLPIVQDLGDRNQISLTLAHWGRIKLILGFYAEAKVMAQDSISLGASSENSIGPLIDHFTLGGVALVERDFDLASTFFEKKAEECRVDWSPVIHEQLLGAWSIALIRAGDSAKAHEMFMGALRNAEQRHSYPGLSYVLPAVALYLATTGKLERAMELYGLISEKTIYGNTPWLEDVVGKRLKELAGELPNDVAEAAYERGRQMDLFETAKRMMEELKTM